MGVAAFEGRIEPGDWIGHCAVRTLASSDDPIGSSSTMSTRAMILDPLDQDPGGGAAGVILPVDSIAESG